MNDDNRYEPCESCGMAMVLGGGLCPDCEAERREQEADEAYRDALVLACEEIEDSIYPDGTPGQLVDQQYINRMFRDLATALKNMVEGD
jgi:hypothetical protein